MGKINKKVLVLLAIVLVIVATGFVYEAIKPKPNRIGELNVERAGHTATLLNDGRVLIVGGDIRKLKDYKIKKSDAEIYNPKTNSFKVISSTLENYSYYGARFKDKALLLKDGRVILMRTSFYKNNGKVEIYDPKKNQFTLSKDKMHFSRYGDFSAIVLNDGRILITGGEKETNESLSSAEIYDPVLDKFSITSNMNFPREHQASILLPNGKVLIFGGLSYNPIDGTNIKYNSIEIYDPKTGKFALAGNLINYHDSPYQTFILQNKKIFIVSKYSELYDPNTNQSIPAAQMNVPRSYTESVKLKNGKILIFGGIGEKSAKAYSTVEMYDPKTNKFTLLKDMELPRVGHTATLLQTGSILITGGFSRMSPPCKVYKQTEVYKP